MCADLRRLTIDVPDVEAIPDLPPWRRAYPVIFTPTAKTDHLLLRKHLALETITSVSATVAAAHHLYVDGSL